MFRHAIHALVGIAVFAAPWVFDGPLVAYAVAAVFVVINFLVIRFGWFPKVQEGRESSCGLVAYPLALLTILPFTWTDGGEKIYVMQTAFVVMALADPAAAIAGRHWDFGNAPEKYVAGKSFAGSIAFGVTAWFVSGMALTACSLLGSIGFVDHWIWHIAAIVGICGAAIEALGTRGWDNLIIVVGLTGLLLHLHGNELAIRALGWHALFALAFGIGAYLLRLLDASGALAAGLLAMSILVFTSLVWAAPPLTFFILASAVSILAKRTKAEATRRQSRGSRRDVIQVLANGGVGWIALLVYAVWPSPTLFWIYSASFAAAAADTWATEVGTMVRGATVSIVGFKPVVPGTSGGVSFAGTVASLVGAATVSVAAVLAYELPGSVRAGTVVFLSGVAGSILDSLLGATVQAQYRTPDGNPTESAGTRTNRHELVSGYEWINNDTVNLACTAAGALTASIILWLWP